MVYSGAKLDAIASDVLMHHGILGMKWGVRRYQNADGSLTRAGEARYLKSIEKDSSKGIRSDSLRGKHVIPKGTTIYRTSSLSKEGTSGPAYVSYTEADRNLYKGGWVRYQSGGKVYEHSYSLSEPLTVPSRDELKEVTMGILNKNPKLLRETAKKHIDVWFPEGSDRKFYLGVDSLTNEYSEKTLRKNINAMVKKFGNATMDDVFYKSTQTLGINDPLKTKIIKELSKRGYNAMTDEASVGGHGGNVREGIDPLIVFDRKVLREVSAKEITKNAELESRKKYDKWKKKARSTTGEWSDDPGDELYHWGIKGMKWGIRRYQNPDGTLTEAGKRRYGTAENFNNVQKTKAEKAASNKAAKEAKAQARRAAAEERAKLAVEKAIKNGNVKQIMRNRSGMTTQQLRDALDRASIVKKIDELNGKKPSVLKRIADRGNSVAGAINAVASVGESVKRVKKAFERTHEQDDEAAFKESAKKAALAKVTKDMMGTDKKDPMSADEARAEYRKAMAQIKTTPEERAKAQAKKEAKEEFKTGVKDIVTANSGNKKAMSIEDVYRRERMRNIKHSDYDARERVESILMHHGIKGQKWGVRRFQNA